MCVAMHPADFKGAIAFGGEVGDGTHLLGYQNTVVSYAGPNCMLLHVPAKEALTPASLLDTSHAPNILKDMSAHIYPLFRMLRGGGRGMSQAIVVPYGAYEVVLATSAGDIPAALERVSEPKRPSLNQWLLDWYDRNYPGYQFVLACFNNEQEKADHPILLRYVPQDPARLFAPGLESHDGQPPIDLGGTARDFKVVFGSRLSTAELPWDNEVDYTDELGPLAKVLPEQKVGFHQRTAKGRNADYVVSVADVRAGMDGRQLFQTIEAHQPRT